MRPIIFVRHGKSQANAERIIATAATPLNDEGRAQARATAEALKAEQVSAIACSPYIRARQTAEIIAEQLGFDPARIHIVDELRERGFGKKEGGPKDHESEWYYLVDDEYGIEPHQAVIERMQRCAQKLRALREQEAGTLVVVGHATAGFYLRQVLAGKTRFADFEPPKEMSNASFVRLAL